MCSDKPCYAPITNFPPTRAGSCQPNANPFGTIQRPAVSPRLVESPIVRSPATPQAGFLSGTGAGVVLRPSLLSAGGGKDTKDVSVTNGSGPTLLNDTKAEGSDQVGNQKEGEPTLLEKRDGESTKASDTTEPEGVSDGEGGNILKRDKAKDGLVSIEIEPTSSKEDDHKPSADVTSSPIKLTNATETPKSNGGYIPTFIFGSNLGERVEVSYASYENSISEKIKLFRSKYSILICIKIFINLN